MGKCITFGEYNKLYKYIWICIFLKLIFEYIFGTDFPEEIKVLKKSSFPKNVLIQEGLNYFCMIILSKILNIYEIIQNKSEKSETLINNSDINSSRTSITTNLIYNDYEKNNLSNKSVAIVIILLIVSEQLRNTFFIINLKD